MTCTCGCGGAGTDCAQASTDASPELPGAPDRFRYGAILERLLDRISRERALGALGRSLDDPAVALLAASAGAHHVLGRTLHRLALDSALPHTEDRAALVRLTGMLGHVPRPAIAAGTLLAFRVAALPGTPEAAAVAGMPDVVTVPPGMKVATVPEQGGQPVTFETDTGVEARAEWNVLRPLRALVLPEVSGATTSVEVVGLGSGARVGDRVLVHTGRRAAAPSTGSWLLARVTAVTLPADGPARTVLTIGAQELLDVADRLTASAGPGSVILLGQQARAFGATAPDIRFMPDAVRTEQGQPVQAPATGLPTQWRDFLLGPEPAKPDGAWSIHLDAPHPEAAPGRVVVLEAGGKTGAARVESVRESARSAFGLTSRCSLIDLQGADTAQLGNLVTTFNRKVRETTLHLETARGTLLARPQNRLLPVTDPGPDGKAAPPQHPGLAAENLPDRLYLAGRTLLPPGRRVILTGRTSDDEPLAEAATVLRAELDVDATLVVFDRPLAGRWTGATLTLLANVVPASHAQTPASGAETLGSGDPAVPLPRFPLRQAPLAHLSAPGPRGYAPAIEVRVGDRRYERTETLYGEGPDSRRYQVAERPEGGSEVRFAGRLPSGAGNVVAAYRIGGGTAGNLPADRLTQILTPVLGLTSVTNPLTAEGGSDAEGIEDIRTGAPKSIRTLDRVVALADFEAFAQGYRGIGKASAVELRSGLRRIVCLTVATTAYAPPAVGSDLEKGLHDALVSAVPPGTHVRISGFIDLAMTVGLALASDPDLRRADVEAAVRDALVRDFGKPARPFGTAVHRSQIISTVQNVRGVTAVNLTEFAAPGVTPDVHGRLPCPGPVLITDPHTRLPRLEPARLLSLEPAGITFSELTP